MVIRGRIWAVVWGSSTGRPSASTQAWAVKGWVRTPVCQVGQVPWARQSRAVAIERGRQPCPAQRMLTATTAWRAQIDQ